MPISEPSWALPFRQAVGRSLIDEDIDAAELARRLDWKPQRLSNYMRGQRKPGIKELVAIKEALPTFAMIEVIHVLGGADDADVAGTIVDMLETELTVGELHSLVDVIENRWRVDPTSTPEVDELPAAARKKRAGGVRKAKPRKTQARPESQGP